MIGKYKMIYPKDFINKIMLGDCLDIMKYIPDKSIDMILCDLPYGTTACKWDTIIPFELLWEQYKRIIKDNGCIALFGSELFSSYLRLSNIKWYKYDWYWVKEKGTGFAFGGKQPLRRVESICIFYKKQPFYDYKGDKLNKPYKHTLPINKSNSGGITTNNLTKDGKRIYAKYTHKTKNNVLIIARDNANKGYHPTQKPVELFKYLIKTYTNENDLVLDNCIGSGTTAIACLKTGRRYIGIEKEQKYYRIALKRVMQWKADNT